jgi:hypothetical protein
VMSRWEHLQIWRNQARFDPARDLEAVARYAGTVLSDSKRKPLSWDRGSHSLFDHQFVSRGLRTGDLRSETGGPTWGLGEKPRIPCALALWLMSPLLYR